MNPSCQHQGNYNPIRMIDVEEEPPIIMVVEIIIMGDEVTVEEEDTMVDEIPVVVINGIMVVEPNMDRETKTMMMDISILRCLAL